jgi:hypothetical protein
MCYNIVDKKRIAAVLCEFAGVVAFIILAIESYPSNPAYIISIIGGIFLAVSGTLFGISK